MSYYLVIKEKISPNCEKRSRHYEKIQNFKPLITPNNHWYNSSALVQPTLFLYQNVHLYNSLFYALHPKTEKIWFLCWFPVTFINISCIWSAIIVNLIKIPTFFLLKYLGIAKMFKSMDMLWTNVYNDMILNKIYKVKFI